MKTPTIQEIPQRLKKFRNDHHLSQGDVAKMLDVSTASIIYWEQGKKIKNIRYHNAMKLFDLLSPFPPPADFPTSDKSESVQLLAPSPPEIPTVLPVEIEVNTKG